MSQLKDVAVDYFVNRDCNCAEATIRAMNDVYQFNLPEEAMKMMGGYGGGFCSGLACGTLCSAMAGLSHCIIKDCAHQTEMYEELCSGLVSHYAEKMGGTSCETLRALYHNGERCTKTVELAGDTIEEYFSEHIVGKYI